MTEKYMQIAIEQAKQAGIAGESPVGAVIAADGVVISRAYNLRESRQSAVAHAELLAIERACEITESWRLPGTQIYVTLEPCPMCMGAIINARIDRVVFGAYDPKSGAAGSVLNLNDYPLNHKPEIVGGVLETECGALLTEFFKKIRKLERDC
ncbi:MAG: nucleoside deaminase [Oscillospiraceae bacterium]|nr:nucleoside deaminase [Oscillospiraceae bacterium]